ncbi:hypothetical protein DQ04_26811000, partial [Trypanosoma grayi]|uniref:hypothetical protein n=1 Tax=Trypanosoma grayi TaxID=71804 RepID=UPI0004F3FA4E
SVAYKGTWAGRRSPRVMEMPRDFPGAYLLSVTPPCCLSNNWSRLLTFGFPHLSVAHKGTWAGQRSPRVMEMPRDFPGAYLLSVTPPCCLSNNWSRLLTFGFPHLSVAYKGTWAGRRSPRVMEMPRDFPG